MMQSDMGVGGFGAILAVLTAIVGLITTVFWMIVGWRAMRAHERISEILAERPR